MLTALPAGIAAHCGVFGAVAQSLSGLLALGVGFVRVPLIACCWHGRYSSARQPRQNWGDLQVIRCAICEHHFETEDMAQCPAYSGAICSLCCSLETRCRDCCKPQGRISNQFIAWFGQKLPVRVFALLDTQVGRYLAVLGVFAAVIGAVLCVVYFLVSRDIDGPRELLRETLWTVFFI